MTYKELSIAHKKYEEIIFAQSEYIANLKEFIHNQSESSGLTLDQITEAVCNYYKVSEIL